MKKIPVALVLIGMLVISSSAMASMSFEFNGIVKSGIIGSLWDYTGGVTEGDSVVFRLTVDNQNDWVPTEFFFELNNYDRFGGSSIQRLLSDLSAYSGLKNNPTFSTDGSLATLNYDFTNGAGSRFTIDFDAENSSLDNYFKFLDFAGTDAVLGVSATILSPVPVPAAFWMLGSGLCRADCMPGGSDQHNQLIIHI